MTLCLYASVASHVPLRRFFWGEGGVFVLFSLCFSSLVSFASIVSSLDRFNPLHFGSAETGTYVSLHLRPYASSPLSPSILAVKGFLFMYRLFLCAAVCRYRTDIYAQQENSLYSQIFLMSIAQTCGHCLANGL